MGAGMKRTLLAMPGLRRGVRALRARLPGGRRPPRVVAAWGQFLDRSQWWSADELHAYQWQKLSALLRLAYRDIPYYQGVFRELGAEPGDFRDFEDFRRFPCLTKETVRQRGDEFLPRTADRRRLVRHTTGGSTAEPLVLCLTRSEEHLQAAFIAHLWGRAGFAPGARVVRVRGDWLRGRRQWERDPLGNAWVFSMFQLTPQTAEAMARKMDRIRPRFLHVAPSLLWLYAGFLAEAGRRPAFTPQAIFCGSEMLYPHQRRRFADLFHCRVFNFYGLAEHVALAGECECSESLHLQPEYGYSELLDADGNPQTGPGASGEIVATGFLHLTMPLIRYRTGDRSSWAPGPCACGRQYPLLAGIEGRCQDFAVTREGRPFAINLGLFAMGDPVWAGVRRLQIVQQSPGRLRVRVEAAAPGAGADLRASLVRFYEERLQEWFDVEIEFCERIEPTTAGKHRPFVCSLTA